MLVERGKHGIVILVAAALALVESVAQTEVTLKGGGRKDYRKIVLDSGYNLQVCCFCCDIEQSQRLVMLMFLVKERPRSINGEPLLIKASINLRNILEVGYFNLLCVANL